MKPSTTRQLQTIGIVIAVAFALAFTAAKVVSPSEDDLNSQPPVDSQYANDVSRLNAVEVEQIWPVPESSDEAERQLVQLLSTARKRRLPVSIAGATHSMGGHTIAPDGVVINMLPFRGMTLNDDKTVLHVQAGALWSDIIPFLDQHARSVAIMQSDSSFSVGGSLSVNAHGWQVRQPPISSSVKSFRLLLANGQILRCSREENEELFSLALGGYGLFGIILDAELWTVANEWYEVERYSVPAAQFADLFAEHINSDERIEMAFGRLRVTEKSFFEDAVLNVYRKTSQVSEPLPPLSPSALDPLRRAVFRSSVGSEFGKRLRWNLETIFGEKIGGDFSSRNQLLNGDVSLYSSRSEEYTDILHEYFIPPNQLANFLQSAKQIIPRHGADLLNVTMRDVREDVETHLRYADKDLIAVVMFFNQKRSEEADARMREMTRELIDTSHSVGGRYYLPYRPHATREQFLQAYPQAEEFAELKRTYDSDTLFSNQFYSRYLANFE